MFSLRIGPHKAPLTRRGDDACGTRWPRTTSSPKSRWLTAGSEFLSICRGCIHPTLIFHLRLTIGLALLFSLPLFSNRPAIGAAEPEFPAAWYFEQQEAMRSNLEGGLAIELSTDTWIGQSTTLADCRGKVVVLDFWATWCGPCVASIPKNIELVESHPDDLVFIGMHSQTSGWDKAAQMVNDQAMNYPVVLDTGETAKSYGINAFPTYIVIDRSGIVRAAGIKPAHVKTIVQQLIEESGPRGPAMKIAAFDPDWFYSGSERMRPWQEQLGQSARPIQARAWWKPGDADGSDPESVADGFDAPDGLDQADLTGVVRVLHFTRPGMTIAEKQLQSLNESAAIYAPQGVVFVVVCDHQSDWMATRALAVKMQWSVPMALDQSAPEEPVNESVMGSERGADGPMTNARAGDVGQTVTPREAGGTAQSYHVRVAPVTVIVDRNGRIRGTGLKLEQLGEALNSLLAERAG